MGCQEARGADENNCCCNDCEHNRITPIDGYCCNCLPRSLCLTVAQYQDDYTFPGSQQVFHVPEATDEDGTEFYEAKSIKYINGKGALPEQQWFLSTSLRRGPYDYWNDTGTSTSTETDYLDNVCYWLIRIDWYDYDNIISDSWFYTFPVYEIEGIGTATSSFEFESNDPVGCLTEDPDNFGLNSIVFPFTFRPSGSFPPDFPVEFYEIHEEPVEISLKKPLKEIMPLENDSDNCKHLLCSNCECFAKCVCIIYDIEFFIPDEDHPNDPVESIGRIRRSRKECWDPEIGENGGWNTTFSPFQVGGCGDGIETTFEFEADEDDTCKLILTTGDLEIEGQFYREEGIYPLDNSTNACTDIYDVWEWGTADAQTGTSTGNYITDSGTASLPLVLRKIIIDSDHCGYGCVSPCCEDIPDELTVLIWTDDDCMSDIAEMTIYRSECHSASYYALEEDVIEWNCDVLEEGHGAGSVEVRFACIGCKRNWRKNSCDCDCDDEGPLGAGCHILTSIRFFDWDVTGTGGSNHSQIGIRSQDFGVCGTDASVIYESSCVPIIADFGNLAVQGINTCCDAFNVMVVE